VNPPIGVRQLRLSKQKGPSVIPPRGAHIFVEPPSYDASVAFNRDGLCWQIRFSWGGNSEPRGMGLGSGAMQVVLAQPHPAPISRSRTVSTVRVQRFTFGLTFPRESYQFLFE
jgi:hypothetical protein